MKEENLYFEVKHEEMIGEEHGELSESKTREGHQGGRKYTGYLEHLYYRIAYQDSSSPII